MSTRLEQLLARADDLGRVDALLNDMSSRLIGLPSARDIDDARAMLDQANDLLDRIEADSLAVS